MEMVVSTPAQLVTRNCSNLPWLQAVAATAQPNTIPAATTDHILDDHDKPTHIILSKDTVYGSGDGGSRSITMDIFARSDEVIVEKFKERR